jgi:hypothetical protein
MRCLHFENKENPTDRTSPDYDRLWKIRRVFSYLNNKYSTLTEQLTVDGVIVEFKGTVEFVSTSRKGEKDSESNCISFVRARAIHTYYVVASLGKQRANAAENITPTHVTVLKLIRKAEGVGHRMYMDNCFSSPQLVSDL